MNSPTDNAGSSFGFLQQNWADLAELARKAERARDQVEPDVVAFRLRILAEEMVSKLFHQIGLPVSPDNTQLDRLREIENADLLDRRLMAKFHTIRKIGNRAAHNKPVTQEQAVSLVEDAFSLTSWFCRFMRPDVSWFTPWQPGIKAAEAALTPNTPDEDTARQPTATGTCSNIVQFPEERIRRIREEVSRAMAQIDPRIRQLRTSITLHEAFTETLSNDQSKCLIAVQDFLSDPEQRVFLLKGDAGTGKTFLEKGIAEYLSTQGRAFRLGAPTGRATKIISEKTGRDARTVHRHIYDFGDLREYVSEGGELGAETFKFYATIANNKDQANTVYIVDEASLLSDAYSESEFFRSGTGYLLHDLISYVGFEHGETDKKIIFVGDTAQLPPVGMPTSPALDAEYLRKHFGLKSSEYELKEVLRQKADSGVIRNVKPLRVGLSSNSFSTLGFSFDDDVIRLRTEEVLPLYLQARAKAGPMAPIVITRSNSEAAAFNRSIRESLFLGRDNVVAGDRLIVTANSVVDGAFLANGEFVDVVAAEAAVERRTVTLRRRNEETGEVDVVDVALVFRDICLAVSTAEGDAVLSCKILDDHLHGDHAGLEPLQQRALYVDFLKRHPDLKKGADRERMAQILRQDPYFNALRVRFGYSVTCHKAQGGEWEHVFVNCPAGHNPRTADYFRWLYTAMTRSSSKLYLIDPPEVRLKVVGMPIEASESSIPGEPSLETFRSAILGRVRNAIEGEGIEIDDVAHHQYQEAFYFHCGVDAVRVNISYNGKFIIRAVSVPPGNDLNNRLNRLLQPLVGQSVFAPAGGADGAETPVSGVPSRPFLKVFHDRLLPLLEARQISISDLKEQPWSQRYTFAREAEVAVVDVFYDGKERLTKCMPVTGKRFNDPNGRLLPEVLEVLTEEVMP